MKTFAALCLLALTAACTQPSRVVVCPPIVDWPLDFQKKLAGELTAHTSAEVPAIHELALRAIKQRKINQGCSDGH